MDTSASCEANLDHVVDKCRESSTECTNKTNDNNAITPDTLDIESTGADSELSISFVENGNKSDFERPSKRFRSGPNSLDNFSSQSVLMEQSYYNSTTTGQNVDDNIPLPPISSHQRNKTWSQSSVQFAQISPRYKPSHVVKPSGVQSGAYDSSQYNEMPQLFIEASRNDIEIWLQANLQERDKSKVPRDDVRQRCTKELGKSFSSRRFGEAMKAVFPQARCNNQGRSYCNEPLQYYYYGVAYRVDETADWTCNAPGLLPMAEEVSPVWAPQAQPEIAEISAPIKIEAECQSPGCPACGTNVSVVQDLRTLLLQKEQELKHLYDEINRKDREINRLRQVSEEKEKETKQVSEKYSELQKKVEIVQRVLSI